MKSTPLLLKGPLVRRSLDGRKTMTRRLVTSLNGIGKLRSFHPPLLRNGWSFRKKADFPEAWHVETLSEILARCPYGTPGDRLWVRETFRTEELESGLDGYRFKADNAFVPIADTEQAMRAWMEAHAGQRGDSWRPAISMPREACRLVMGITEVRIEQLQDITDDAIRAEGVAALALQDLLGMASQKAILQQVALVLPNNMPRGWKWDNLVRMWPEAFVLQERWRIVWGLVNGHRPGCRWEDNPPVWVLQYERLSTDDVLASRQWRRFMGEKIVI